MTVSLSRRVMRVYEEFDRCVERLPIEFGLHCPPGCGTCCASPNVEATILEMLPLAEELWQSDRAEAILDRFATASPPKACLFFTPDELQFNYGRCSVYPFRPTMCRLFGFAAVRNKYGRAVFAACKFMKQMIPEAVQAVQTDVDNGGHILRFTDAAHRIAELEPSLDRRFPINEALLIALERVGMYRLLAGEVPEPVGETDTEPPPPSPFQKCC